VGIAAGDHGWFVVRGCGASGGRGEGDGPDPWVGPGSEGRSDAHGALSARGWAAGAGWWGQACSGYAGDALVGRSVGEASWAAGVRVGRGGKCGPGRLGWRRRLDRPGWFLGFGLVFLF